MRLSKKTIYAIILMLSIVKWEESEVITIKKVAERENLSVKYLEQVVSVLCKSGFVKSQRGAKGGYRLSKAPEQYCKSYGRCSYTRKYRRTRTN